MTANESGGREISKLHSKRLEDIKRLSKLNRRLSSHNSLYNKQPFSIANIPDGVCLERDKEETPKEDDDSSCDSTTKTPKAHNMTKAPLKKGEELSITHSSKTPVATNKSVLTMSNEFSSSSLLATRSLMNKPGSSLSSNRPSMDGFKSRSSNKSNFNRILKQCSLYDEINMDAASEGGGPNPTGSQSSFPKGRTSSYRFTESAVSSQLQRNSMCERSVQSLDDAFRNRPRPRAITSRRIRKNPSDAVSVSSSAVNSTSSSASFHLRTHNADVSEDSSSYHSAMSSESKARSRIRTPKSISGSSDVRMKLQTIARDLKASRQNNTATNNDAESIRATIMSSMREEAKVIRTRSMVQQSGSSVASSDNPPSLLGESSVSASSSLTSELSMHSTSSPSDEAEAAGNLPSSDSQDKNISFLILAFKSKMDELRENGQHDPASDKLYQTCCTILEQLEESHTSKVTNLASQIDKWRKLYIDEVSTVPLPSAPGTSRD